MAEFTVELEEGAYRHRPMRIFDFSDHQLYERFRFTREGISLIANVVRDDVEPACLNGYDVETQVMAFLGYAASPNFQRDVADRLGMSQATVCRVVDRVGRSLSLHANKFIRWPNAEEARRERIAHYAFGEFPRVVGTLDGTEIRIERPGLTLQEAYYNGHKKTHTIKVLASARTNGEFSFVDISRPGSWHDSATDAEYRYNQAHLATRNRIEKFFGIAKRRFYMLGSKIRLRLDHIPTFILGCLVCHNIATQLNIPIPSPHLNGDEADEEEEDGDEEEGDADAVAYLRAFAERHFGDQ